MALCQRIISKTLRIERYVTPTVCATSSRNYSDHKNRLTDLKRGRGGRSSFSGVVTTIFGATGYLGRFLVNKIGKIGSQIIIPYRGDPYDSRHLKLAGDVGQVLFMPFHLEDEASIRKAVQHSNVVINLIGRNFETRNFTHNSVHVDGAARLARISREMGVEKYIHFSALNANKETPGLLKAESTFLQSKALGEVAVKNEFPEAIIFRPADMYGDVDHFLHYYKHPHRRMRYDFTKVAIPLWRNGKETIKQPVYASDVAQGVVNALLDPECRDQVFEAVGPHRYQLIDLVRWIYLHLRYDVDQLTFIDMWKIYKMKVALIEKVTLFTPQITMERLEREFHTDKLTGCPTLEDLAVNLTKLEDKISFELKNHHRYGYYWDALGEFPDPPSPPLALA